MNITTSAVIVVSTIALGALAQISVSSQPEFSATIPSTPEADYRLSTGSLGAGIGSGSLGAGIRRQKASSYGTAAAEYTQSARADRAASPAVGQVSVMCFKQPDPKEIGETMEDIATLSFLVSRNLQHTFASDTSDYKLGIPMLLTAGNQGISASYVQGFAAILKMQVRFPVAEVADEEPQTEPATNPGSEWEQARRQVVEGENPTASSLESAQNSNGHEPYDSKLVHTLERRVLVLLKNATNIRHMDADEWIIMKVVGTPNPSGAGMGILAGQEPENANNNDPLGQMTDTGRASKAAKKVRMQAGMNQATVMTLRVRKSDADSFASGSLSEDQFIKNAQVASYFNPVQADVSDEATWGNMARGAGAGGVQRK